MSICTKLLVLISLRAYFSAQLKSRKKQCNWLRSRSGTLTNDTDWLRSFSDNLQSNFEPFFKNSGALQLCSFFFSMSNLIEFQVK